MPTTQQTPAYRQFRELAQSKGWSVSNVAKQTQAGDPLRIAERIMVHLAGTRFDNEPLPYPKLIRLYHEALVRHEAQ